MTFRQRIRQFTLLLIPALIVVMNIETAASQEAATPAPRRLGDPYPFAVCPVSGEKFGSMGEPVIFDFEGREIRFCCKDCVKQFQADPTKVLAKIDKEIVAQQSKRYPLKTCVVSGEALGGEMGEPIDVVHNNRLARFCCKSCVKEFGADPEKFLKKLDAAAIEQQKEHYPLKVCLVSGDALGGDMGEPIDMVYGNRLVRFCCKGCIADFRKTPATYLEKLDAATKTEQAVEAPAAATTNHQHAPGDHAGHQH